MKILYSVQATGNGHISRALDVLPHLKKYGDVDVFLSGANSTLDLPGTMYRSKGLSFFYNKRGGLDYRKTFVNLQPFRVVREAKALPVEKYDAVINDFESITSLACTLKSKFCVGFGHQASFKYPLVPMAKKFDPLGRFILKNYAPCDEYVGLHFKNYDWDNVFNPILNERIVKAGDWKMPKRNGTILVYLPSYSGTEIYNELSKYSNQWNFSVFNKTPIYSQSNFKFFDLDKEKFADELIDCSIVITSAGFETPAEALYLSKKLAVIPIKGQYEQACNAQALQDDHGVHVAKNLRQLSQDLVKIAADLPPRRVVLSYTTEQIVEKVMKKFA